MLEGSLMIARPCHIHEYPNLTSTFVRFLAPRRPLIFFIAHDEDIRRQLARTTAATFPARLAIQTGEIESIIIERVEQNQRGRAFIHRPDKRDGVGNQLEDAQCWENQ